MNHPFTAHRGGTAILALFATILGAGCSNVDGPVRPPSVPNTPAKYSLFDPEAGFIAVGEVTGPAGTYAYHVDVVGGGLSLPGPDITHSYDISKSYTDPVTPLTGMYHYAFFPVDAPTWAGGVTSQVTITEINMPPGRVVDSIKIATNGVFLPTLFAVNSVSLQTGYDDVSFIKVYHSQSTTPPPPFGKGCTPGYWKQTQHFKSWVPTGLAPTNLIGSVFSQASLYTLSGKLMSNYKLVDGLGFKGGPGSLGAAQILLRAAIAAELNARYSSLGYPMTAADIVTAVNDALAGAQRPAMLTLAAHLDDMNNLNCPLN